MNKVLNGKTVELTPEEVEKVQADAVYWEAQERHRPLKAEEVTKLLIKQQINNLEVDDNTALRMLEFYPEWAADTDYTAGFKVQYSSKLWRCKDPGHTSQEGWEPSTATASLWEQICETHDGTQYDPIPFDGNMELAEGLYYTQDGVTYLCNRSTGQPVYNALADLVGLYVEVAE